MYAIMRLEKHKSGGGLTAALQHLYRERYTPNADSSVSNLTWAEDGPQTTENAIKSLHKEIESVVSESGRKLRKDAVVAVEYVMTTTPEFFNSVDKNEREQRVKEFARLSREWIREQYPDGKIIAAQVHMDETTPHLSVFVTPTVRVKGVPKFSAYDVLGSRKKLSEHQDSFHKKVEHLGLKRGIKGSKATHEKVSRFYSKVVKSVTDVENIYTEDAAKIDKLASRFGSKTALAEFAKDLSHDNLKLRHVINDQDTQKRIERVTEAHGQEIENLTAQHKTREKELTRRLTSAAEAPEKLQKELSNLRNEATKIITSHGAQVDKLEQEIKIKDNKINELELDFRLYENYDRALAEAVNALETDTREQLKSFLDSVRYTHLQTAVDQNLIKFDELSESSQKFFNKYEQEASYTRTM